MIVARRLWLKHYTLYYKGPLCINCHAKERSREEEYKQYINKTLEEGFKCGIWNEEEYMKQVMYPED